MGVTNLPRVHNFFREDVDMKRRHIIFTTGVLVAVIVSCVITRSQHTHENSASRTGAIQGRVLNPEGEPVAGAEVHVLRYDLTTGRLPTVYTDNQGKFLMKDLIPGRYTVSAGKTSDGYADKIGRASCRERV